MIIESGFLCSVGRGGDGDDHNYTLFRSDYIHAVVSNVNNICYEIESRFNLENLCDHIDWNFFLSIIQKTKQMKKGISYQCVILLEECTCILRVCDGVFRKMFVPEKEGVPG